MLDAQRRIWGIDHGLCFHEQYKMRTVIWDWAQEPIPVPWIEEVECVRGKLVEATDEALAFAELLSPGEVSAIVRRIDVILSAGTFPKPGPHRSYPWPLV